MNISKEQFTELVIALEHRNLTMGLEASSELLKADEIPEAASKKIEAFEALQHEVYATASQYGMEDQFETHEDTNQLVLKPDSELEQKVWDSAETMEKMVAYEMIVRHKAIECAQKIRDEHAPDEPKPEELLPAIEKISKKYWGHLTKKGLEGLLKDL